MLVRAFRVTDRLGNAALRVAAWAAMFMTEQAAHLKTGLIGIIVTTWRSLTGAVTVTTGAARVTQRAAQDVATRRQESSTTGSFLRRSSRNASSSVTIQWPPDMALSATARA